MPGYKEQIADLYYKTVVPFGKIPVPEASIAVVPKEKEGVEGILDTMAHAPQKQVAPPEQKPQILKELFGARDAEQKFAAAAQNLFKPHEKPGRESTVGPRLKHVQELFNEVEGLLDSAMQECQTLGLPRTADAVKAVVEDLHKAQNVLANTI